MLKRNVILIGFLCSPVIFSTSTMPVVLKIFWDLRKLHFFDSVFIWNLYEKSYWYVRKKHMYKSIQRTHHVNCCRVNLLHKTSDRCNPTILNSNQMKLKINCKIHQSTLGKNGKLYINIQGLLQTPVAYN